MNKILLFVMLVVFVPALSFAQLGISWGIGPNVTFPASDLGDAAATGFGGTGLVKLGLIPIVDVTAGIEYVKFGGKDITTPLGTGENEINAWGYLVGGRVSVFPMIYAGLETGAYTFSSEFTIPSGPSGDESATKFFFSPMVGVNISMFDANLRYVIADGNDFVSLRGMVWF
jgi:hypothetical protein